MDPLLERERRLLNRLAIIKLANQILDQRTDLTPYQQKLVSTAIDACDELVLQLMARQRAQSARLSDGRPVDPTAAVAASLDRAIPPDDAVDGGHLIDAIVIAHDRRERKHLEDVLALQGYGVQSTGQIDATVEQLLAERRRLVVLSPDPDVGQAEIEAQVHRLRAVAPRSAILICLDRDQAPRAVEAEQMVILRRPFRPRDLLRRTAELYPAGPPRRLPATRPSL